MSSSDKIIKVEDATELSSKEIDHIKRCIKLYLDNFIIPVLDKDKEDSLRKIYNFLSNAKGEIKVLALSENEKK